MTFAFSSMAQVNAFTTSFSNALEEAFTFENVTKNALKMNKDGSITLVWKISNISGISMFIIRIYSDFSGSVEILCGSTVTHKFSFVDEIKRFIDESDSDAVKLHGPCVGFLKLQMQCIYDCINAWAK
jgi:hypothetical protein